MTVSAIAAEATRVTAHSRRMIEEYVTWGSKIRIGEIQQGMYDEILDFVNFRVETAASCLLLIEHRRLADALGLCRSLLENYLLLMLMCRGRKFFRLQSLEGKTTAEIKKALGDEQAKLAAAHEAGEQLSRLEVRAHPRFSKLLMHVFEGLTGKDESDFIVPVHYFHHQDFDPQVMRLKEEDYFSYFDSRPNVAKARKEHRKDAQGLYRYFLSYDALIDCLRLNDLLDDSAEVRLEAHYTFLGKYLHPTHEAGRRLRDQNNYYLGGTGVGIPQHYSDVAVLLASVYVACCLSGVLGEAASLIESAPTRYIADAGTGSLRAVVDQVPKEFAYFWFIFNEAPLWDKYKYATYQATNEELARLGHYSQVPSSLIRFDQDIYGHLRDALSGCHNSRCGTYRSPV